MSSIFDIDSDNSAFLFSEIEAFVAEITIPRNSKGSEQGPISGGSFNDNPIFEDRYSIVEAAIASAFGREPDHITMSSEYLK